MMTTTGSTCDLYHYQEQPVATVRVYSIREDAYHDFCDHHANEWEVDSARTCEGMPDYDCTDTPSVAVQTPSANPGEAITYSKLVCGPHLGPLVARIVLLAPEGVTASVRRRRWF